MSGACLHMKRTLDETKDPWCDTRPQSYERFTSLYLQRFYLYSQVLVNTSILWNFFTCIHKEILQRFGTSQKDLWIQVNQYKLATESNLKHFGKKTLVKQSESFCETFTDLVKVWKDLFKAIFTLFQF